VSAARRRGRLADRGEVGIASLIAALAPSGSAQGVSSLQWRLFVLVRECAPMESSRQIEQLVADWFAAATTGDASLVRAHVSPGEATRLIGSDPDEVYRGGAAVAEFLTGEVEGAGGQATFEPNAIEAFSEGTVGWATALVTITMPDGKHVSPRWSAVFHQEDGLWKFVQTHASIAVRNDQIGWVYPD
jgi:ketosteroid isomerase-like protein